MKTKKEVAVASFRSGMNCAQSVLSSFTEEVQADKNVTLRISSGFMGGMGKLQKTCGAVTGSFMVIGLCNSAKTDDPGEIKSSNVKMIQEFNKRFIELHQHTDCSSLIKCDLNTEEGQRFFSEQRLGENVCEKCIMSAVGILEELL